MCPSPFALNGIVKGGIVDQHVKIVAILNIVFGVIGILIALGFLIFFGGLAGIVNADHDSDGPAGAAVLGLIGGLAFLFVVVLSIPCVIAGYGLLHFRPWALTLTIVMSILNLMSLPFGTALGIYSLWVMMNKDTKPLFRAA
jgi:hypothetical protein